MKKVTLALVMFCGTVCAQATTLQETISFPNTTTERLYQIYLSSAELSAVHGMPAVIDPKVGGTISTFGGAGEGRGQAAASEGGYRRTGAAHDCGRDCGLLRAGEDCRPQGGDCGESASA